MLYIRLCFDKSGTSELRNKIRHEHRAYFKPNMETGAAVRLVQAGFGPYHRFLPACISAH